jgi:hypothetical protein
MHFTQERIVVFGMDVPHFCQIGGTRAGFVVQRVVGRQRSVRRVRVPVMHEEEKRTCGVLLDEAQCALGDLAILVGKGPVQKAGIEVVAAREPVAAPIALHHQVVAGGRDVAVRFEQLRQQQNALREMAPAHVAYDAVTIWVQASEHRRKRRHGRNASGDGAHEDYAFFCQRIDMRRSRPDIAIAAQVIWSQCVDSNDDNIGLFLCIHE